MQQTKIRSIPPKLLYYPIIFANAFQKWITSYSLYYLHIHKLCLTFFGLDNCRNGYGRFYLGTMNVTKSGIPCQRWDSQHPHKHMQPPLVFPQIADGENYCRNAGGEEPAPWCYTVDETVRWQHCDISLCRM